MNVAWGDAAFDQSVADWLLENFPELKKYGRFKPNKSLALLGKNGEMSGGIIMTHYSGFDAELSIFAPGVRWTRGALADLFSCVFDTMELKRITVRVSIKNKQSRRFVERLGFKCEGVIRKGYDGKHNLAIYGMLREDCRWIKD